MWSVAEKTGRPLYPSLRDVWDWPYTVMTVVQLRRRYDSYLELSEPIPEEHWDYPHLVRRHIERLYPRQQKSELEVPMSDIET